MPLTQFSLDRSFGQSTCSAALTEGLAESGARALAILIVPLTAPRRPRLVGASAGASASSTNLCLALAEGPADGGLRQIEVAGIGCLSWKTTQIPGRAENVLVFALYGEKLESLDRNLPAFDAALDFSRLV